MTVKVKLQNVLWSTTTTLINIIKLSPLGKGDNLTVYTPFCIILQLICSVQVK